MDAVRGGASGMDPEQPAGRRRRRGRADDDRAKRAVHRGPTFDEMIVGKAMWARGPASRDRPRQPRMPEWWSEGSTVEDLPERIARQLPPHPDDVVANAVAPVGPAGPSWAVWIVVVFGALTVAATSTTRALAIGALVVAVGSLVSAAVALHRDRRAHRGSPR